MGHIERSLSTCPFSLQWGIWFLFLCWLMKLKTSNKVSLWFVVVATLLVACFALLVNIFFFSSWFNHERKNLLEWDPRVFVESVTRVNAPMSGSVRPGLEKMRAWMMNPRIKLSWSLDELDENFEEGGPDRFTMMHVFLQEKFQKIQIIAKDSEHRNVLKEYKKRNKFVVYNGMWLMYLELDDNVRVSDVTHLIQRQIDLLHLSFYFLLLFVGLSYGFSLWFVGYVLKDLVQLGEYVADLNVDTLDRQISFPHLTDDDEINRVANALNDMSQKISKQVWAIRRFVSYVSHEFKTPLMMMQASNELCLKAQKYRQWLEKNIAHIWQLNRLLESLLLLTKIEGGQMSLGAEREKFEAWTVVKQCVDRIKDRYSNKNIVVWVSVGEEVMLHGHQWGFESIVTNIIDNAFKYTTSDWFIDVVLKDRYLSIEDNGQGMKHEEMEHMWDDFWQADSSKWQDQWFGLGLSLVKRLVEMNGWRIDVKSRLGKGTKFTIFFSPT